MWADGDRRALGARSELLASMEPFLVGGGMVENVTYDETSFARDASRFEAGTPNVADAVGLAAAIDYLDAIGMDAIRAHERDLIEHGLAVLGELEGVRVFGPRDPERQSGVLSFTVEGVHPHDIGTVLDHAGIAIRAGKHCCHPAMACLGIPGTARASVYLYNTHDELDRLAEEIVRAGTILGSPIERRNRFCQ
ncbi:MAG: aminotransferase class V-fold PLP-dependent enzyme [Dehalococcoidia bacterium]